MVQTIPLLMLHLARQILAAAVAGVAKAVAHIHQTVRLAVQALSLFATLAHKEAPEEQLHHLVATPFTPSLLPAHSRHKEHT